MHIDNAMCKADMEGNGSVGQLSVKQLIMCVIMENTTARNATKSK